MQKHEAYELMKTTLVALLPDMEEFAKRTSNKATRNVARNHIEQIRNALEAARGAS